MILDNIRINGPRGIDLRPTSNNVTIRNVIIRNSELIGTRSATDSTAIMIGPTGGTVPSGISISNIVIYNCHIAYFGDKAVTEQAGIYMGFFTERVWVLNNDIHDVGADAVAGCHNANNERYSRSFFIGGNKLYRCGENSIDLKAIEGYIISQNEIYGPYTRENGWGIVLHYGAYNIGCSNGWVLFNNIRDTAGGIISTSNYGYLSILGNQILNTYKSPIGDPLDGCAIGFRGTNGTIRVVNNTLYKYQTAGIRSNQSLLNSDLIIENNLFLRMEPDALEIWLENGNEKMTKLTTNHYYYKDGSAQFYWKGARVDLQFLREKDWDRTGSEGDPDVEYSSGFVRLKLESCCIDRAAESAAYQYFQNLYGRDVRVDIEGNARPPGLRLGYRSKRICPNTCSFLSPRPAQELEGLLRSVRMPIPR